MKIIVLAGGLSPERDVSLSSGALIANALIGNGHKVALIDLYLGVKDTSKFTYSREQNFKFNIPEHEPNIETLIAQNGGRRDEIGENVLELCAECDRVFIALHGGIGENGKLQAALDCKNISYTGSSYSGCLVAMDKDISKRLMRQSGICTADWVTLDTPDAKVIKDNIGLPCVIKPLSCGSSVGVSIVRDEAGLDSAMKLAAVYEERIIAEEYIKGREFSVGVLLGKALPPIEISPKTGFYDYKNKYQGGQTVEICPADLTAEQTECVKFAALAIHKAHRLGSYSRSDFILDEKSGEFFALEVNALPGMTPTSLLPQEAAAVGISYAELCEAVVEFKL